MLKVGAVTVKDKPFDWSPPGFTTATAKNPALFVKLAGTVAATCVTVRKVVGSALPFQETKAPDRKFVPLTFRVNPPLPAATEVGSRALTTGVWAPQAPATNAASIANRNGWKLIALFRKGLRLMRRAHGGQRNIRYRQTGA